MSDERIVIDGTPICVECHYPYFPAHDMDQGKCFSCRHVERDVFGRTPAEAMAYRQGFLAGFARAGDLKK